MITASPDDLVHPDSAVLDYVRKLRKYSNKEVNRAGVTAADPLFNTTQQIENALDAIGVISEWRAAHEAPVTLFRQILTHQVEALNYGVVASRLKRLPTILDKLQRLPDMQLSTMQDVGGLRVIVDRPPDAEILAEALKTVSSNFDLKGRIKNYIRNPAQSGYRGIHLIYSYVADSPENEHLNGLKIEVQIRSRLQHAWATAVEVVGTFRRESLKSGEGSPEWLELFRLAANAMAKIERTPAVPGVPNDDALLAERLTEMRNRLNVNDRIRDFWALHSIVEKNFAGAAYYLLSLNRTTRELKVRSFKKTEFDLAIEAYRVEEAVANENIDTVLVVAESLAELKEAYPNYFVDTSDFLWVVYDWPPNSASASPSSAESPLPSEPR